MVLFEYFVFIKHKNNKITRKGEMSCNRILVLESNTKVKIKKTVKVEML